VDKARLFKNKLWLAPMAGYTDSAYRRICKSFGADVVVSEMASADALLQGNEKTVSLSYFSEAERPIGLQIFGSDPEKIAKAAKILQRRQPDFIDLNMGCPMKKIVKTGAGAYLLRDPIKVGRIVAKTRNSLDDSLFLTVKIRAGWDSTENFKKIVRIIASEGADAICIHPRLKIQMFEGKSNWELIRQAKESVNVPIIGNGDITTPEHAEAMFKQTGCDSVMIGRGAIGNPWIFHQIKNYLQIRQYKEIMVYQKIDMLLEHYLLLEKEYGTDIALKRIRKFIAPYTKGARNASMLRRKCNEAKDREQFVKYLIDFKDSIMNYGQEDNQSISA
jgi:nifR3 family TIM-barrel protein